MCNESAGQREYLRALHRSKRFVACMRWGILIVAVLLWEALARFGLIDAFLLSSPSRMLSALLDLVKTGELWLHVGTTLAETLLGFVIGSVLGIVLAAALWWSPTLSRILDPYLVVLNALPKIALGPVLIVWIGAGMSAIVMMTLLVSVIVTMVTVLGGFLSAEEAKLTLLKSFGASKWQCFSMVVFPSALPNTVSALKLGIGMSWVGVIVGEFLVSRAGLGYLIVYGGQVFKLDLVMAGTAVLCVLAALMYLFVAFCENKLRARRA